MDEQLPVLKDFQAEAAPPEKPEPWWVRGFAYTFFTATMVVGFKAESLFHNSTRHRYLGESDSWFTLSVIISGFYGLALGLGLSVAFELGQRNRRSKAKPPRG